jgi:hypothetical protein
MNAGGALRDLGTPRASVIRGGRQERIDSREVVVGDPCMLDEGDRIPADGVRGRCTPGRRYCPACFASAVRAIPPRLMQIMA